MDKLAERLRRDAANIDADVSAELDRRIQASLHNVTPEQPRAGARTPRAPSLWWASSLTGVAAAIVVIVALNLGRPGDVPDPEPVAGRAAEASLQDFAFPAFNLNVEAAMLTSPLAKELENLQSDLKKAEQAVRDDVKLDL